MVDSDLFLNESPWEEMTQGDFDEESLCITSALEDIKAKVEPDNLYMDIDDVKKAYDNVNLDILSQNIIDLTTLTTEEKQNALSVIDDWRNLDYDFGGEVICKRTRGILKVPQLPQ
jgi:hypothetical protein